MSAGSNNKLLRKSMYHCSSITVACSPRSLQHLHLDKPQAPMPTQGNNMNCHWCNKDSSSNEGRLSTWNVVRNLHNCLQSPLMLTELQTLILPKHAMGVSILVHSKSLWIFFRSAFFSRKLKVHNNQLQALLQNWWYQKCKMAERTLILQKRWHGSV